MKHAASPMKKGIALHRRSWRFLLVAGLVLSLLVVVLSLGSATPTRVFASVHVADWNGVTSSPTQGPVGAVISVTGSNLSDPDGTSVQFGYSTDFSTCNRVSDSHSGVINNGSFSGWLRWPASTGTGSFGVCALVGTSTRIKIAGIYNVLSASPPQITVAPTILTAGKQATVSGANFFPNNTSVDLVWRAANGSQAVSLGTVTSDGTGAFSSTFTVPPRSGTGSYSILATTGDGPPATLSASTTFHVNGITIVPVATPAAQATPTLVASPTASASATANSTPGTVQPTSPNSSSSASGGSGLILPIALVGFLLVVAALVAGVLFVRRQRELAAAALHAGEPAWSAAPGMGVGRPFASGAGYSSGDLADKPTQHRSSYGAAAGPAQDLSAIPFDPALAEAMRQAQVSMFATPRPPVEAEATF